MCSGLLCVSAPSEPAPLEESWPPDVQQEAGTRLPMGWEPVQRMGSGGDTVVEIVSVSMVWGVRAGNQ